MLQTTPVIVATYAEIALKGRNRTMFMRKLIANIRTALKGLPIDDIAHVESRLLISLTDSHAVTEVTSQLRKVFGLQWISPAVSLARTEIEAATVADLTASKEPGLEAICTTACALAAEHRAGATNFKVATRRSDRSFPLGSPEISRIVGGAVFQAIGLPGKMNAPDLVINILVLKNSILVFCAKEKVYGGLPAGSSGRLMVLLSGGIDSPVAAWLMMRRGCRPDFVHFFSGRSAAEADTDKIQQLTRILAEYYPGSLRLHLVPVVPYEMRAMGTVPDSHDMVMFRRFMFKTAASLARGNKCRALVSGDSLGQVASQTIHNLGAITPDIKLPIFRPLIGMDKQEITAWSRETRLFDTSILPYRDCCSIRSPKPVLNARPYDLLRLSKTMDLDAAVLEAIRASVRLNID